ncbi:MAG: hypothetical protein GX345_02710 [Clostridiales bacterium]|nr:hypothetical protein [Clostridiales bacterium]
MLLLFNQNPLDTIPCPGGFIFLLKEKSVSGQSVITFYRYDQDRHKAHRINKDEYLFVKFGKAYLPISKDLGNYVSCRCLPLKNGNLTVIDKKGVLRIYSDRGDLIGVEILDYHGAPFTSIVSYKNDFWASVPQKDCVVCYSPREESVMLRVGGSRSKTFKSPVCLHRLGDKLFVCSKGDFKVRQLDLNSLKVTDYAEFEEPVLNFFISGVHEYALLESGMYRL